MHLTKQLVMQVKLHIKIISKKTIILTPVQNLQETSFGFDNFSINN